MQVTLELNTWSIKHKEGKPVPILTGSYDLKLPGGHSIGSRSFNQSSYDREDDIAFSPKLVQKLKDLEGEIVAELKTMLGAE